MATIKEKAKQVKTNIQTKFNNLYIISSFLSFGYYIFYAARVIYQNGIKNIFNMLLIIFVCLYGLLMLIAFINRKNRKTIISHSKVYIGTIKKLFKIVSLIMSIYILVYSIVTPGKDVATIVITIYMIVFDIFRIIFTSFRLTFGISKKVVTSKIKTTYQKIKEDKINKKQLSNSNLEESNNTAIDDNNESWL